MRLLLSPFTSRGVQNAIPQLRHPSLPPSFALPEATWAILSPPVTIDAIVPNKASVQQPVSYRSTITGNSRRRYADGGRSEEGTAAYGGEDKFGRESGEEACGIGRPPI